MLRYYATNEEVILNYIRRYGPVSKATIARNTSITAPTVTNICTNLVERGLIVDGGQEKTPLGRPSQLLKFNGSIEEFLIIHVRTQKIHFYVTNSCSKVLFFKTETTIGLNGEEIIAKMHSATKEILGNHSFSVKGIGIILRGPVDSKEGISVFSPHAKWSNMPFRYIFEETYHLPVYIENDMHALTTGEYLYGQGRGVDNLLVIKFSYGLGATLMVNGNLYRGFSDGAGELGHTLIACQDGVYRTLEEVGSETSIRNYFLEAIDEGKTTLLKDLDEIKSSDFKVEPIYEAALKGDELALESIKKAGEYLGIAIANMINVLNPEKIVLSSDLYGATKIMDPILKKAIDKYSYRVHPIEVSYSSKGYEKILHGMIDIICTERAEKIWLL